MKTVAALAIIIVLAGCATDRPAPKPQPFADGLTCSIIILSIK